MQKQVHLTECPRDAMQGWPHLIATDKKIAYINALLKVGFDIIDFGSFVSPKAIPQMADTKDVLRGLQLQNSSSKLLAIVANARGAADAVQYDEIDYIGFPFSVSPTFQLRNTNSTPGESLMRVEEIQDMCIKNGKRLVVYLSMGFGNPYGDAYSEEMVLEWVDKMVHMEVEIISMADTVGLATPAQVSTVMKKILPAYPAVRFTVHLHSSPANWQLKLEAALDAGCTWFDGALRGIGGCPMAGDELIGNMDTGKMVDYLGHKNRLGDIDRDALELCNRMAAGIFI